MEKGTMLVLTRVLPATRERVFAAWTEAAMIKQWFCPSEGMSVPVAELDVREGGAYRMVIEDAEGETYSPGGTYEQIVPNERLVFSWKWADSGLVTRVTIDLRALSDTETELTLRHEGFPETEIRDRHIQGWEGCLAKLQQIF
ncbi:MAG: SRPBCC domain-containing protein [Woeseia sp.]